MASAGAAVRRPRRTGTRRPPTSRRRRPGWRSREPRSAGSNARRGTLKIKAPFDGVVTRRAVNTGDLVSASEKVALFTRGPDRPGPGGGAGAGGRRRAGRGRQDVRVALQAVAGTARDREGGPDVVVAGARVADTANRDRPAEPKGSVRPGMYVYARLTVELPAAWAVPAAAVGKVGDESVIYLVEGGKAVRVAVQLRRGDGQFTQVRRYKKPGTADWTDVTGANQSPPRPRP